MEACGTPLSIIPVMGRRDHSEHSLCVLVGHRVKAHVPLVCFDDEEDDCRDDIHREGRSDHWSSQCAALWLLFNQVATASKQRSTGVPPFVRLCFCAVASIYLSIDLSIYLSVKPKTGPRFGGVNKLKTGPSSTLKTGPSFFTLSPNFIVFLGYVQKHK